MSILKTGDIGRFDIISSVDLTDRVTIVDNKPFPKLPSLVQITVEEFARTGIAEAILNPTDTFFPIKDVDRFIDSSLRETATELISAKTLVVPSSSVIVGDNLTATDNGGFLSTNAIAFNEARFYSQSHLWGTYDEWVDNTAGTQQNVRVTLVPSRWQENFLDDSLTNTTKSITFPYVTETDLFVEKVNFRFAAALDNVRVIVERSPDFGATWFVVWKSHNDDAFAKGAGYSVVAGENILPIPPIPAGQESNPPNALVNFGRSGELFRGTVQTNNAVLPIKGQFLNLGLGLFFYPFLLLFSRDWFQTNMPNTDDVKINSFGKLPAETRFNTDTLLKYRYAGVEQDGSDPQLDDSATLDSNDLGLRFFNIDGDAEFVSFTIKVVEAKSGILFEFRNVSNPQKDLMPNFFVADIVIGDNTFSFPNELIMDSGDQYAVDIFGFNGDVDEEPMKLKGKDFVTPPYFTYRINPMIEKTVAPTDNAPFVYEYYSAESFGVTSTTSDYDITPITALSLVQIVNGGSYEIIVNGFCDVTTNNRSVTIDMLIDSVSPFTSEFELEPKDNSNNEHFKFRKIETLTAGSHQFDIDFGKRGGGGAVVSVSDITISVRRIA
jgi:hypothetical protein